MKSLLFLIAIIMLCILGMFTVGVIFYISMEVFFYIYAGVPLYFEVYQFKRLLRMSVGGGGILGLGIGMLHLLKVKGF
jgi:hypothetical protein